MPLSTSYVGTELVAPIRIKSPSRTGIRVSTGVIATCTPAWVMKQAWAAPATIVTNGFSASHAGAGAAGTTSMTLGGSLAGVNDYARNVVITVTHGSAVVAMNGIITGTDIYGKVITETWSVTAAGTTKTYTGTKAFKTVTSITETVAADASANTIIAGNGKSLGLQFRTPMIKPITELEDAITPTAGATIAGAGAHASLDWRGVYTPNSTLDTTKSFVVYYLVDDLTDIG